MSVTNKNSRVELGKDEKDERDREDDRQRTNTLTI